MAEGYSVVFTGELLDGVTPERARAGLMKVFQIGEDQARSILSGGERVIKRGIGEEKAARYREALGRVGMVARVDAPAAAFAPPPVMSPVAPPVTPPMEETVVMGAPPAAARMEGTAAEGGGAAHPFRFTGQAGEYFRIWIVNILLTIVTLGVYSAWAKVRNNRYFYGNTHVAGGSFEYLAQPLAILKGRIIAVVLFLIYGFAGSTQSVLSLVALLLLAAALPWLISRSLSFRNRNTALRNIRFGFDGGYGGAAKAFLLFPAAAGLSFGLLAPIAVREQDRYVVANSRYGTTPFEFNTGVGAYYRMFGAMLLILIGGMIGILALLALFGFTLGALGVAGTPDDPAMPAVGAAGLLPFLSLMLLYLFLFAYLAARRHNLIYNGATFSDHGFAATMTPKRLAWIQITNWAATLATLGLARPWAKVRLARYKAECLTLAAAGSLDAFIAAEEANVNAMGEELGEAFDFDFGL